MNEEELFGKVIILDENTRIQDENTGFNIDIDKALEKFTWEEILQFSGLSLSKEENKNE